MKNLLRYLFPYLWRYKWKMAVGFFFLFVYNYLMSLIPGYFRDILNEVQGQNRFTNIVRELYWVAFLTALTFISVFLMRIFIIGASRYVEYHLRQDLFEKLMRVDESFYQKNQTGDLMSRCTNDLNDVRTLLGPGIMYIPNALSRLVFYTPVLFVVSAKLFWIVVGMVVLVIVLIMVILPRLRAMYAAMQSYRAGINENVWETIVGIDFFRLYDRATAAFNRFRKVNAHYIDENMRIVRMKSFSWPFFIFLISLIQFLLLLVGGQEVIKGRLDVGALFQYIVMVSQLTFPILSMGWVMSIIQSGISALDRLKKIIDEKDEVGGEKLNGQGPLEYEIRDLRFEYEGDDRPVLNIHRLHIKPRELVGITGKIGCGKSTLLKLLLRVLKPQRGQVFVNGVDINDLESENYRQKVAVCSQEAFLFSKSILYNVGFSEVGNIDEARVVDSLRKAHLWEDVERMKDGLSQIVGERGVKLSGGQFQRLILARGLYSDREALFLDDMLSAVDSNVEQDIIDNLSALRGKKTLFFISNRVSTLKFCDRIIVMKEGSIVEEGTHDGLLERKGYYYDLYRLQQLREGLA